MGFVGKIFKGIAKVVGAVFGIVAKVVGGIFGFLVGGATPTDEAPTQNTLSKSIDPEAPRKIVFGRITGALDIRFWEVFGGDTKQFVEVIALASHEINAVQELYIEDELAINAAGVVQGKFVGVLTRSFKLGLDGQTALAVGSGTQWNANSVFNGVSHMALTWTPDEKKLPSGIPSRYTQIVEGMPLYDPRRDTTVSGGSGSHRIDDQTTWTYSTLDGNGQPIGRNNALQALAYLIGWTIQTKNAAGTITGRALACGRGILPEDINLQTFITGANNCEVAGYYTDLVLSTENTHTANENSITANGLLGRLIDPGGLWSYYANIDDTAIISVELTDADVLESSTMMWDEYKGMSEQFNQVVGKYVNPVPPVLYQPYSYPMVRDAIYETNLGIKKRKSLDFTQVLDGVLAQRLARLYLNQGQYQGELSAGFNYKALKAQAYSVVRYQSDRFGWTKLFRVWRHEISSQNGVSMLLKEIHSSIWGAGTVTFPEAPSAGAKYNSLTEYSVTGLSILQHPIVAPDGTKGDGFKATWTAPPDQVRRTQIRYKLNGTTSWTNETAVERDELSVVVAPLFSGAIYDIQARHISVHNIAGPWINGGPFQMGATGNVNYAAIEAAGGTANWSDVVDDDGNKPEDNADVTLTHISDGFTGEGTLARRNSILASMFLGYNSANNIIADPDFEDNAIWNIPATLSYDTSLETTSASFLGAQRGIKGVGDGTTTQSIDTVGNVSGNTNTVAVEAGKRYAIGLAVFLKAGFTGRVFITYFWRAGADEGISNSTAIGGDYRTTAKVGDGIEFVSKAIVAPTGAIRLIYRITINWSTTLNNASYFIAAKPMLLRIPSFDLGDLADSLGYVTQPGYRTIEGLSDGFIGEGFLARENSLAYGGSFLSGFGSFAGLSSIGYGDAGLTGFGLLAARSNILASHFLGYNSADNTILDPDFEDDSIWYCRTDYGYSYVINSTVTGVGANQLGAIRGIKSPLGDGTTTQPARYFMGDTDTNRVPVEAGKTYRVGVALFYLGGFTGRLYIQYSFYDGAGVSISTPTALGTDYRTTARVGNTVEYISKAQIAPAGAVRMRFRIYHQWSTTLPNAGYVIVAKPILVRLPSMTGNDLYDSLGYVTQGGYRTLEGIAGGFTGQGLWATYSTISPTTMANKTSFLDGTSGRIINPSAYNTQFILAPRNSSSLTPTYTVGGSNVTVNIPAHTRYIAGTSGRVALSYGAGSFTVPFSTYWMGYVDDAAMAGVASPAYNYTTVTSNLLHMNRYHVASGTSPTSGGTGGDTGGGGGGTGGSGECVAADSYMPDGRQAFQVDIDDEMLCVDYNNYEQTTINKVTAAKDAEVPCIEIETVSGIKLVASTSTPITLHGGLIVEICDAIGRELPVQDENGFRWELCIAARLIGKHKVRRISCHHGTYAAGKEKGRFIFTHNPGTKP